MSLHTSRTVLVCALAVELLGGCGDDGGGAGGGVERVSRAVVAAGAALFVVGNTTLAPADAAVRNRLQDLGFTVTVESGAAASTADATGKALVVISATVDSSDVNT